MERVREDNWGGGKAEKDVVKVAFSVASACSPL